MKGKVKFGIISILILAVLSLSFVSAETNNISGWNNITLSEITISVPNTTETNISNTNGVESYVDKDNKILITVTNENVKDNPYLVIDSDENVYETVESFMIYNETINGTTGYTAAINLNKKSIYVYSQNKDQLLNILKSMYGGATMTSKPTNNAESNIQNSLANTTDTDVDDTNDEEL